VLGRSILPETPMAHTASGGLHLYFAVIDIEIRNSAGEKGLGPGLDVRGEGGFIVVPSEGSGYSWDPHCNLDTVPLMPAPSWLGHREKEDRTASRHGGRLKPQAILDAACENIRRAPVGERHDTLNREVFTIAAMVRAGAIGAAQARHQLEAAVATMTWGSDGDRRKAARDFADAWKDGFARGRAAA
jgi:Bifunctional DNA primase/polymerase, N-terminal